ncbi:MAG: hypothetical protein DRR19_18330 [Candidatus Parabeggiatoa sp. nov. 1]|nr:MAG: hypothetical protein DRR19_18330 [Gammaproteobacteria bacterium]
MDSEINSEIKKALTQLQVSGFIARFRQARFRQTQIPEIFGGTSVVETNGIKVYKGSFSISFENQRWIVRLPEDQLIQELEKISKIEVPLVGVLPDGSLVDEPSACYEALFKQATTQATVFRLEEV